jgi:N-acetylmuramic acid 6-phosphate etherase
MKSGTAQKMVLNMITTASMVRIGKTYGNVMVDLQLTNQKLIERARKIVMTLGNVDYEGASQLLTAADGHVKTALVMAAHSCSREEAINRLALANGHVRIAVTSG